MKFVSNAGSDRVMDLIRPWLKPDHRMEAEQEPRLVPQRRGADQAGLPGPAQHQPEVDHADPGLEGRADPIYHSVRRPHLHPLKSDPFTQKFGHAPTQFFSRNQQASSSKKMNLSARQLHFAVTTMPMANQ